MRNTSLRAWQALLPLLGCFLILLEGAHTVLADDWPVWRGPTGDGISAEKGWSPSAVSAGKVLWRAHVGKGHASFAVAGGKVYTLGNADGQDSVFCFDAETGQQVWKTSYACRAGSYPGPRATPTVDGALVYTLSRDGQFHCLEAASGKIKWKKQVDTRIPKWGLASSPIVHGDLVVLNTGTSGTAFHKTTGKRAWSAGNGVPGYASAVVRMSGSKATFLIFSKNSLICVSGKSGRPLWDFPWQTKYDVNASDPVLVGKSGVFISSGYNKGCAMLRVGSRGASKVWQNTNMRTHMASCVSYEGHLYGFDDKNLRCIDKKKGDVRWTQGGFGKGGMMMADGKLIIISENGGNLVVAEASSKRYAEVARAQVTQGHTWTPPVLANGRIYVRNDAGDIVCVDARGN